jgi:hypothetical protein
MKGRKQTKSKETCPPEDRAELDNRVGGQTYMWITERSCTNNPEEE